MDLPPPAAVSQADGGRARSILSAIVLPIVILAGSAVLVAVGVSLYFQPREEVGFLVQDAICVVDDSSSTALVQLSVVSQGRGPVELRLEALENPQLFLVNLTSLPHGLSVAAPSGDVEPDIRRQLDDSNGSAEVVSSSTNVAVELRRDTSLASSELKELTFVWSSGEPSGIQSVPIGLVWDETTCAVDTE